MDEKADEKLKVRIPANRCPFCHDDVQADESVACQGCLARHHEACWSEAGRCGSCGDERSLRPAARPPVTAELVTRVLGERGYSPEEVQEFLKSQSSPTAEKTGSAAATLAVLCVFALAAGILAGVGINTKPGVSDSEATFIGFGVGLGVFVLLSLLTFTLGLVRNALTRG